MKHVCVFDPKCDLHEVDQFGFVNLAESFEKGILVGDVVDTDETFNMCNVPASLLPHGDDVFTCLRQRNYVAERLRRYVNESKEREELAKSSLENSSVTPNGA